MPDTTKHPAAPSSTREVGLWMTGALLAFCGVALSIRALAPHADLFEVNAIRTGGGLLAVSIYLLASGRAPLVGDVPNLGMHALRNLVHWGASLLWTASITLLPLATVFALEFTTPLWVAIFAVLFLGQRVGAVTFVGLCAGLAGAFIIIRPDAASFDGLASLPLATAAALAVATLMTKQLTRRNGVADILFWMMALQFAANLSALAWNGKLSGWFNGLASPAVALPALALVAGGLASQVCLTKALRVGSPVSVCSFDFLRVPMIAAIGFFLYGEQVGLHTALGALVIVAAAISVLRSQAGAAR